MVQVARDFIIPYHMTAILRKEGNAIRTRMGLDNGGGHMIS